MVVFHIVLVLALIFEINCGTSCEKKFKNVGLAPKFFDYGTPGNLKVVYADNNQAKCGNGIPVTSTENAPVVTYNAKRDSGLMSIIMFEPNSLLPTYDYVHWFVVNIPVYVIRKGYSGQAGRTITKYGSAVQATGNYKFTFCVYYQNEYIKECKKMNTLARFGTDPRFLVKKYNLQNAAACNFFYLTAIDPKLLQKPIFP